MVFIGEESSKRRVNTYISKYKYISMSYYIMFLWIPGRVRVTGNFLVNALHAFHRLTLSRQEKYILTGSGIEEIYSFVNYHPINHTSQASMRLRSGCLSCLVLL